MKMPNLYGRQIRQLSWQGKKASNPRPTVLETAALPAELFPCIQFKIWWTVRDSNPGPTGYEPAALPTELTVQIPFRSIVIGSFFCKEK